MRGTGEDVQTMSPQILLNQLDTETTMKQALMAVLSNNQRVESRVNVLTGETLPALSIYHYKL